VRILLDENLPESLASALQQLGHHVDTINSLRLKGLDNGTLYRKIAQAYTFVSLKMRVLSTISARCVSQRKLNYCECCFHNN